MSAPDAFTLHTAGSAAALRPDVPDPLTGLPGRAALMARLAASGATSVALFSIGLDQFRLINDGFGHAAGDDVLRQLAARLAAAPGLAGRVARQGGDQFVVAVEGLPDGGAATEVARTIAELVNQPLTAGATPVRISASVGFATLPAHAEDVDTLERRAEMAMFDAKSGGGGIAHFVPRPSDAARSVRLSADLRDALGGSGGLTLAYQPIFRLADRCLMGVEALLRWSHPLLGSVPPDVFVPLAERTGLMLDLGDWVFRTACRQLEVWDRAGLHPRIGINVSPLQLGLPDLAQRCADTADGHGVDRRRIVIELTESAWMLDPARTMPLLDELREAGFRLALDDFGAGHSSLARLGSLTFDIIKVDRAFLAGIPDDAQAEAILDAILNLAKACENDVVMEGVETDAQLDFLVGRHCALGQGFGLARPAPADAVTALLGEHLAGDRRT